MGAKVFNTQPDLHSLDATVSEIKYAAGAATKTKRRVRALDILLELSQIAYVLNMRAPLIDNQSRISKAIAVKVRRVDTYRCEDASEI
jgi:hypothetical protein